MNLSRCFTMLSPKLNPVMLVLLAWSVREPESRACPKCGALLRLTACCPSRCWRCRSGVTLELV